MRQRLIIHMMTASIVLAGQSAVLAFYAESPLMGNQLNTMPAFGQPIVKAQEFEGINHVLGILEDTNIYRNDKYAAVRFEELTDMKSAVNNSPLTRSASLPTRQSQKGLQAPPAFKQRSF